MTLKLINAVEAKPGVTILVDGQACIVRTNDVSKTGKHGHAKCRMDVIGVIDNKKRVIAIPGHERMEVPVMEKRKAQVLSVNGNIASVMDMQNFETIDIPIFIELEGQINPEDQVEYWIVNETDKIIKRKAS